MPADDSTRLKRWTGPANIAWCPECGLHGARGTCFECGKPVEQIEMIPTAELRAAPTQPSLSAEDRERLEEIACICSGESIIGPKDVWDRAATDLRHLASAPPEVLREEKRRWTLSFIFGAGWKVKGPNTKTRSSVELEVMPVSEYEATVERLRSAAKVALEDQGKMRVKAQLRVDDLQNRLEISGNLAGHTRQCAVEEALEEAAKEFEQLGDEWAEKTLSTRYRQGVSAGYRSAAQRLREKQAALKGEASNG